MRVSVIVPVLDDAAAAERLLAQFRPDSRVEIIIADGGGDPAISALAAHRDDVTVVRSAPGRAVQMNAGAARSRGDWLLFLHADSTLPDGWIEAFAGIARDRAGGWFRFALDERAWQARAIERAVRWRVRWLRLPYGDQGIFVRREVFVAMGGYRELPLMEDVEFVRRLTKHHMVVELPLALTTSARRWRRDGWFTRSGRNVALLAAYFAGVRTERLARLYFRDRR